MRKEVKAMVNTGAAVDFNGASFRVVMNPLAVLLFLLFCGICQAQRPDQCSLDRRRLAVLDNELRALEGLPPLPVPGQPSSTPQPVYNPDGPKPKSSPQRDEEGIKEWHRRYDAEHKQLTARLLQPPCKTADPPPAPYVDHPFDIVADQGDANGLPFNPVWKSQKIAQTLPDPGHNGSNKPYLPPLTSQSPKIDETAAKCPYSPSWRPGPFGGHADWTAATYTGRIFWSDHSSDDDDYNFNLSTPDRAGSTTANPTSVQLEFDSDETIDHFHSLWWKNFHSAVDDSNHRASSMVYNKEAIVIGLLGLDCAHTCGSEIHPVFVLAIHIKEDPSDDVWAIFVRNWGDEGYCSHYDWQWSQPLITLSLPMSNASAVEVVWDNQCDRKHGGTGNGTCFLTNTDAGGGPYVDLVPNIGANVSFTLPAPDKHGRINGELHLKWTVKPGQRAASRLFPFIAGNSAVEAEDNEFADALAKMSPAAREQLMNSLPHTETQSDEISIRPSLNAAQVSALRRSSRSTGKNIIPVEIDAAAQAARARRLELLRRALGDRRAGEPRANR